MANLVVVLIVSGFCAYQYFKGSFVKSFTTFLLLICASFVAFGYFEILSEVFISRGEESSVAVMFPWMQSVCFILLFALSFAIFQAAAGYVIRQQINLGAIADGIGRAVCGIFSGLIVCGLLLVCLAMAPLPNKYPYPRFDESNPNAEKPQTVLLNPDGFATGWFSMVSQGSFRGKRSFATIHAGYLNQVFLNRHSIADEIPIVSFCDSIEVPKKAAAWLAPEGLKDADDPEKSISSKSGYNLTIVRFGMKKRNIIDDGEFTLSQLRLICKDKSHAANPLTGKGKTVYPIGYMQKAGQLQLKKLDTTIRLRRSGFEGNVKWIDLAFYVPENSVPVLIEFKQNRIAQIPKLIPTDQAPATEPF